MINLNRSQIFDYLNWMEIVKKSIYFHFFPEGLPSFVPRLSLLKRVSKCVIMSKERSRWDLFWRKFMMKPVSTLRLISWSNLRPPPAACKYTVTRTLKMWMEWRPKEILMAFTMMEIMIMFSSRNRLLRTPIKGLRKQCKPPP